MKKGFRKIGAVLLTFAMALVMNSTVFAAGSLTDGKVGSGGSSATIIDEEAVNIVKDLMPVNPENSTINAPTISYSYEISSGSAGNSITDVNDVNVNTKAGILSGLKVTGSTNGTANTTATSTGSAVSNTISWTTGKQLTANTVDSQNLVIDFSGVEFVGAGVYRYVITESVDYTGTGVTPTNGTHTRYLDVYVKDGTGTGAAAWDVYGFVCSYANNADINEGTDDTANNIDNIAKTNGFVSGTDNNGDAVNADTYYTYNVTISKTLTGDSFNNSHQFPFNVSFVNSAITANVDIIGGATGTATAADLAAGALNTAVIVNPTIANGGTATYVGIPVGTTVTVYETNDIVGTTYASAATITTSETDDTAAASKNITYNVVSNNAIIGSTAVNTAATGNKIIAFTNDFTLISPTGFVVRFAPYALVLLGGILLIAIGLVVYNKSNKKETA